MNHNILVVSKGSNEGEALMKFQLGRRELTLTRIGSSNVELQKVAGTIDAILTVISRVA
jgi:hypothetical protein